MVISNLPMSLKGDINRNQGDLTEELYCNYRKFLMIAKSNPFSYGLALLILTGLIIEKFVLVNKPEDVKIPPFLVDAADTRRDMADYYDEISRMDRNIGIMLGELEKRGELENTIIVFMSDTQCPFGAVKVLADTGIQTLLFCMG